MFTISQFPPPFIPLSTSFQQEQETKVGHKPGTKPSRIGFVSTLSRLYLGFNGKKGMERGRKGGGKGAEKGWKASVERSHPQKSRSEIQM